MTPEKSEVDSETGINKKGLKVFIGDNGGIRIPDQKANCFATVRKIKPGENSPTGLIIETRTGIYPIDEKDVVEKIIIGQDITYIPG